MTREETVKIIRIICGSYPNFKPTDISETVDIWNMMFDEYTYDQVSAALKAYILSDSSGFAPSVGQIVEKVRVISTPNGLNELEAWAMVRKALRNSAYGSETEFAKLPETVQRAVGSHGQLKAWAIDEEFNEGVASSNFMRSYRMVKNRAEEISKMPEAIRLMIEKVNQNSYRAKLTVQNALEVKDMAKKEKPEIKAIEDKEKPLEIPDKAMERLREFGLKD